MAGGIVLQMDQAAFTNNEIFGYNRERSQNITHLIGLSPACSRVAHET
jgi:hypothetical protein